MILEQISIPHTDDPTKFGQYMWPFSIPAIARLRHEPLAFRSALTFLVGDNGAGKSTLMEAIAEAYGLDVRGGHGGRRYASPNQGEPGILATAMRLHLTREGALAKRNGARGFFLRAETALGMFEYMSDHGVPGYGVKNLRYVSHGEGLLQVLAGRFQGTGLYLLDEPEAGLSLRSCISVREQLVRLSNSGAQVICATHSPILIREQPSDIFEVCELGIVRRQWAELDMVREWQHHLSP